MTLLIWWKTLKEVQKLARVKQVHQLSDELHAICTNVANEDIDWSELPWILEARVKQNCKLD